MSDEAFKAGGTAPPKTVAQMLGEITWLLTQSPVHRHMFVGDLEWFCMPPLMLEQYRIFNGPQAPAAVVLWAFVSAETEARLEAGAFRLRPDEWRNGDRLWLMEMVAPFGAQEEILADLSTNVFPGRTFKYHRTVGDAREVVIYDPATVVTS